VALPSQPVSQTSEHVELALAGDAAALELLLREATPSLRAGLTIDARFRRSLDIDDVLQVTFLEAYLRIRSLEQRTLAGFRAWLSRIAEHNLADAVRSLQRGKRPDARHRVTHGGNGESARTLLLAVADAATTAGAAADRAEEIARLHRAIAELPASYRAVIEQVDLAERPVAEVAAGLQRSEGAVHMLRARARARLQELLRR